MSHQINWGLVLVSILAVATTVLLIVLLCVSGPTVQSLGREIDKQLPHGSTKSEVLLFLDSRQITHSDLQAGTRYEAHYLPDGRRVERRSITAVVHKPYRLFPAEKRINIIFYFDESERLIDYDMNEYQIAP